MKFSRKGICRSFGIFAIVVLFYPVHIMAQSISDGMASEYLLKNETAKNIYNKILVKEPGNTAAIYHLGIIAYKNYQYDSARFYFNQGNKINAGEPLNYIGFGLLDLHENNNASAKNNFDKALSLSDNKDPYVMQQIVDAMWTAQETSFADFTLQLAQKAVSMDGKNPRYAISLGDAYRLAFESSKGIAEYKKLADANPGYLLAQLRVGEMYAKNNLGAAEDVYNKILAKDPSYPPLYPDLAELYTKQNKPDQAKENYLKFLNMVGNSCAERTNYASFLYILKDYKNSLDELNIVLKCLPDNINIIRLKAYCEFELNDYTNTIPDLQKVLSNAKKEKILNKDYIYLGKAYSKTGQDSLAIININKAIAMDSTALELYDISAEGYMKIKKYSDAAELMERKMIWSKDKIAPIDYFTLGRAYYYSNNFVKADTNFAMVNKFYPTYAAGFLFHARAKAYQGTESKIAEAKPLYDKFLELVQPDAAKYKDEIMDAETFIGKYYVSIKDYASAKEHFLKVKALDPDNKENNEFLKFINAQKKK